MQNEPAKNRVLDIYKVQLTWHIEAPNSYYIHRIKTLCINTISYLKDTMSNERI